MTDNELGQPTSIFADASSPEQIAYDRFELTVTRGPDKGLHGSFGQSTVHVGTARTNDFVLTDPTVSRFHLRIETDAGRFSISDSRAPPTAPISAASASRRRA